MNVKLTDLQIAAQRCFSLGGVSSVFRRMISADRLEDVSVSKARACGASLQVSLVPEGPACEGRFVVIEVPAERGFTVPADVYSGFTRVLLLGGQAEARLYKVVGGGSSDLSSRDKEPKSLLGQELMIYGFVILLFLKG